MNEDEMRASLAQAWEEGAEALESWVQETYWTNSVPERPKNPYNSDPEAGGGLHRPDDECEKQVVNIDDKPAFIVHHALPRK